MADDPNLKRLGQLVVARRLDLEVENGKDLARLVGVSPRVITDVERGNRTVGPKTKARLEKALKWAPGSVDAVVKGGAPTELPTATDTPGPRSGSVPYLYPEDRDLIHEYESLYRELIAARSRANALEEQLAALAPLVDQRAEAVLDVLGRIPGGEEAVKHARATGVAFLEHVRGDPAERSFRILSPIQRYVNAAVALRSLREGGDGHADSADDRGSASTSQRSYELIAHDEEHTIESEQGHDETS